MTTYKLPATKPHVVNAANHFGTKHGIKTVYGWRAVGSVKGSDHPKGLALDFMTRNKAQGDALAADLVANYKAWNITYVIWWRRIWNPEKGWHSYSGPSAHTDHVHASFSATAGKGETGGSVIPVANPLVPDSVESALAKLQDPQTWKTVGFYMLGSGLVILGFLLITVGSLPGAGTIARVATKVVK